MLRNQIKCLMACSLLLLPSIIQAQDDVTNAFDDLKRQGTVNEQDSEMRRTVPSDAVNKLIQENPACGYFCFTEDRMHDIRMTDAIPLRWVERPAALRKGIRFRLRLSVVSISEESIRTENRLKRRSMYLKAMYRHYG